MEVQIPAFYYAQQGADPSLPHPGESFGGWKKTDIPIDWDHTAIIVMHAWAAPDPAENKESCRAQQHREYGLWQFATQSGFVFLSEELKTALPGA